AVPHLRAWVEGQQGESAPLLHFATLLADLGAHDEAAVLLDRALNLEPESAALHRRRGDLARKRGEKRLAADHYRAALTAEPEDPETRFKYGSVLASLGDPEGAIAALERALEDDADLAEARYELGLLYYTERGDAERALAQLDEALRLAPENATAKMIRQEILLERERG
ncbi:MAG TPA: tetratricopeptide repeat protein, partial [Solirubrobacterales bacterium]|nr:tetratricopeptide repeat protein [Solirubrobacterales bacterium]